jgi:5-methylthioadenosine/S-adenosylhomocysteine deaminase
MHLHESAQEIETSLRTSGMRPIERLANLGILNASLMAVHAVHLRGDEIDLFASSGVTVAHCPRSNLKLADGIAPVTKLLAAGVPVALGTDGAASNNELDMLGEIRTAALLAKVATGDASAMPAANALRLATLGGAEAIGLADTIGSIARGKWADLVCVDLQRLNSQPLYDPLSQLVYTAGRDQVSDVWVAGRQQIENGTHVHIDIEDVLKRSDEWRQRIMPEQ